MNRPAFHRFLNIKRPGPISWMKLELGLEEVHAKLGKNWPIKVFCIFLNGTTAQLTLAQDGMPNWTISTFQSFLTQQSPFHSAARVRLFLQANVTVEQPSFPWVCVLCKYTMARRWKAAASKESKNHMTDCAIHQEGVSCCNRQHAWKKGEMAEKSGTIIFAWQNRVILQNEVKRS